MTTPISSISSLAAQYRLTGVTKRPEDDNSVQDTGVLETPSAADAFLAEMKKSPAERMRDQFLKSHGLTPEELENMPPEQRAAVEQQIAEEMKRQMTEKAKQDGNGAVKRGAALDIVA